MTETATPQQLPRLRYEEHSWPQLHALSKRDDLVIVIPAGTLEDHGHHLPIDTDVRLVEAVARGAVERFNAAGEAKALLFPTAVHGYTPHHMDFPGTVTLRWDTFVQSLVQQGTSLCHHGFDRILIVNGHGSNAPLVNMAARLIDLEHPGAVCASSFYLQSERAQATIARVRRSGRGGMAHACELETSLYLALRPDLVEMQEAVDEIPADYTDNWWMDWSDGPLSYTPAWSAISRTGVTGAATRATAETGRALLEAAHEEIAGFIADVAALPHPVAVDHH